MRFNPLRRDDMKYGHIGAVLLATGVLSACTTPILVADADGRACHQNYEQVKKRYGEHFARPCVTDTDQRNGIVEISKADALQVGQADGNGLMQTPVSFSDSSGVYTRSHFQDGSVYYWMLPYPTLQGQAVLDQSRELEARWHNTAPQTVRLYVYHRFNGQDMTSIRFDVDGASHDYVATWPAEALQNAGRKNGSVQYFDVPYQVVKGISQAHQAEAWLGYADGSEYPMVLVAQGEPSLAAQGLRRFFNAIETR